MTQTYTTWERSFVGEWCKGGSLVFWGRKNATCTVLITSWLALLHTRTWDCRAEKDAISAFRCFCGSSLTELRGTNVVRLQGSDLSSGVGVGYFVFREVPCKMRLLWLDTTGEGIAMWKKLSQEPIVFLNKQCERACGMRFIPGPRNGVWYSIGLSSNLSQFVRSNWSLVYGKFVFLFLQALD